ncbi:MAG: HNH endonuclease [Acidobacteriota bacterium]|nr:HNH endonuclease [Acidobacteriota bacterium]
MKRSVMAVNISWNPYNWQKPYTDPRAGHSYARKFPGHESVNFHFNKPGIDTETEVYGYSQWQYYPKNFLNGGYVLFFTKNLDTNQPQIVGLYGDVTILNPQQQFHYDKFENNKLMCNMKAAKALSLQLPLPLDANNYSSGRMVGQIGFTYYDESTVQKVVSDEYSLLEHAGGFPGTSYAVLNRIYDRLTGNPLSKKKYCDTEQSDFNEQNELEKIESQYDILKILDDLRNVKATDSEQVEIHGKAYKRDNKTIAQLKIVRGHKCQICSHSIKKKDGSLYVEAAHITPKKNKGTELPSNIIILCPNHHKEFDLGKMEVEERTAETLVVMVNEKKYSIDLRI